LHVITEHDCVHIVDDFLAAYQRAADV